MSATTLTRRVRPEAGTTSAPRADRRTVAIATALVAAPIVRGLGIALHPFDTADAGATIALVGDNALRWAAVHLIEPYSMLVMAVAVFALLRLAPARGRRLVAVGATLFSLGAAAIALLVYSHGEAYLAMSHSSVDPADVSALYARFHDGVPLSAPFIPGYLLGPVILGFGLFRAGHVSKVAAVALAISSFVPNAIPQDSAADLVAAGILGSVPMVAAMAVFARALLRQSRSEQAAVELVA